MRIKIVGGFLFVANNGARGIHAKIVTNGTVHQTPNQSRIVGGNDAEIGGYPFFVEWEGCGASLIHKGKMHLVQIAMVSPIDIRC